jgi:hypothetical protein
MFKGKVLLFSLLIVFATSAFAGDVDDCLSDAGTSCTGMRVSICPAGDFEYIYRGCGGSSDYIWVVVKDSGGNGIPGVPWTDYWMDACDEPPWKLCLCPGAVVADSLTNDNGETTISGRLAMGGCVLTGGVYLSVQGKVILMDPPLCTAGDPICLDLELVSPDRNADCAVNLSDLVYLADSYNKAPPDPAFDSCCDWNDDDIVNLSDFAFFGEHYTHVCF